MLKEAVFAFSASREPKMDRVRPAESRCRGEGGGGLDRFERGWVAAHADLGVERDGGITFPSFAIGPIDTSHSFG